MQVPVALDCRRRHRAISLPLGPVVKLVAGKSVVVPITTRMSVMQVHWWWGLKSLCSILFLLHHYPENSGQAPIALWVFV